MANARTPLSLILAAFMAAASAVPALAHHGWGWTQDAWFNLSGTITDIYIGNPHATLTVEADGKLWDVDLAPLARTLRAGFVEGVASKGDRVELIGHRAIDEGESHMKAVRVIVNGQTFDVYPQFAADYDAQS